MLRVTVPLLVLAGVLTSCGDGSEPAAPPATTSTTPTTSTPTSAPASTPASTPASSGRDKAALTKALLDLKELPTGLKIAPPDGSPDATASSKDAKCARLVELTNAKEAPGSKASVNRMFSAGENGPSYDESLAAMGSEAAVKTLLAAFKSAVTGCAKLELSYPGLGTSPIRVRKVDAPQAGESPFAVHFTATGGRLKGLETTLVVAGVDDVILTLWAEKGVDNTPADTSRMTKAAVKKASSVLGS